MEELQLKHKSLKQDLQRLLDEKEDIVREKEEMNIKVEIYINGKGHHNDMWRFWPDTFPRNNPKPIQLLSSLSTALKPVSAVTLYISDPPDELPAEADFGARQAGPPGHRAHHQ